MTLQELIAQCQSGPVMTVKSPLIEAAMAQREKAVAEKAVMAVTNLLSGFERGLTNAVETLRVYRKSMDTQKKHVDKLDRAFRYFAENGNPFPMFRVMNDIRGAQQFASQTNLKFPESDSDAWEVPADWTPSSVSSS